MLQPVASPKSQPGFYAQQRDVKSIPDLYQRINLIRRYIKLGGLPSYKNRCWLRDCMVRYGMTEPSVHSINHEEMGLMFIFSYQFMAPSTEPGP